MFSTTHFIQVINQQILILGINYVLLVLVVILMVKQSGVCHVWPNGSVMTAVVIGYLFAMLTYETGVGVWDWDIFAPAGFVVTAALLHLLMRRLDDYYEAKRLLVPLIASQAVTGALWVLSNHR